MDQYLDDALDFDKEREFVATARVYIAWQIVNWLQLQLLRIRILQTLKLKVLKIFLSLKGRVSMFLQNFITFHGYSNMEKCVEPPSATIDQKRRNQKSTLQFQ